MVELQQIVRKVDKDEYEKMALEYVFARATWGEDHLQDIRDFRSITCVSTWNVIRTPKRLEPRVL